MIKIEPSYKVEKIESLGAYITYLNEAHDADDLLFRGQSDDSPLIPKLGRIRLAGRDSEVEMFAEFQRQLPSYVPKVPNSPWEVLAIAQHHGMATRYLDWTTNPMAALWFAVEHPFRLKQNGKPRVELQEIGQEYGVVWILRYEESQLVTSDDLDPFKTKKIKIYNPPLISARILAQAGFFTVHPPNKVQKYPALELDKQYGTQLTKIVIPAKVFPDIRRSLDRCGFNAATMMVDLDGVASHIAWQNSLLDDEDDDTAERTVQKVLKAHPGIRIFRDPDAP